MISGNDLTQAEVSHLSRSKKQEMLGSCLLISQLTGREKEGNDFKLDEINHDGRAHQQRACGSFDEGALDTCN